MSASFLSIVACGLAVSSSAVAFAAPQPPLKPVSYAELKDRCLDPEKYPDIRVSPQVIVAQCAYEKRAWIAEEPGAIPAATDETIQAGVTSSEFVVDLETTQTETPQTASCPRLREVLRSAKLEIPMTCSDLQKYDDVNQICAEAENKAPPKVWAESDTGFVIDTCANLTPTHP